MQNRSQTEFSLVIINGLMHHYINEKWIIIGQSRIGIYHDSEANTFRIVGRKLDNYDVSIFSFFLFCFRNKKPLYGYI